MLRTFLSLYSVLTAYSHVRTEPQCDIGQTRGKKNRAASQQELDDMLKEYDMKRDSVEINHDAPQWSHPAVWKQTVHGAKTRIHTAATMG